MTKRTGFSHQCRPCGQKLLDRATGLGLMTSRTKEVFLGRTDLWFLSLNGERMNQTVQMKTVLLMTGTMDGMICNAIIKEDLSAN